MSEKPPRQPSHKPPAARPPVAQPLGPGQAASQAASKPPVAHAARAGGYAPEEPEPSGTSTGSIIGIIAAVLLVVIGLPVLSCVGCIGYGSYQAKQLAAEALAQEEQARLEEEQKLQLQENALLVLLTDRLYEKAKLDIAQHWTEPERIRRRRWADWAASRVDEDTFDIGGNLELSIRDVGTKTYRWSCRYSTSDDPRSAGADWSLEKVVIDGAQQFP